MPAKNEIKVKSNATLAWFHQSQFSGLFFQQIFEITEWVGSEKLANKLAQTILNYRTGKELKLFYFALIAWKVAERNKCLQSDGSFKTICKSGKESNSFGRSPFVNNQTKTRKRHFKIKTKKNICLEQNEKRLTIRRSLKQQLTRNCVLSG